MEIEFSGQLDKRLYRRALSLLHKPSRTSTIIRLALTAVLILAATIAIVDRVTGANRLALDWTRVGRYLFALPAIVYVALQPYFGPYLTTNRLWRNAGVRATRTGTVSERGVTLQLAESHPEIRWADVARWRANDELVVLITTQRSVLIMPRHFFRSEADWQQFREWIAQGAGKAA